MSVYTNSLEMDIQPIGDITVGTSQVEVRSLRAKESIMFRIRADKNNTGVIFIGKSGVLTDGSNDANRLESGDEWIFRYNDKVNELYAISDTSSQKINVGVFTVI